MGRKTQPDLCVVSYSNLNYDARSANLIAFYRNNGLDVVTYSISTNKSSDDKNLFFVVQKKQRFFINWIKFALFGVRNFLKLSAKKYFAADLYSLVFLRLLFKSPKCIIYDSREIFSELGTLHNQSLKQKILSLIEKIAVKGISKIVVSGELDAEYLKNYFNDTNKHYFVVKNLPIETRIVKTNYLREKYNIPEDKTVLIYQGVVLKGRGILPLIDALKKSDKFAFVIIGEGNFIDEIKKIINHPDLNGKVFLHPQVKYSELLNITASADIGVSLIEPITFSYQLALPNKLFEYIYAGLPVLVSDLPAMRHFVLDSGFGEVVQADFNPNEILEKLNLISNNICYYKNNIERKKNELTYTSQENVLKSIL